MICFSVNEAAPAKAAPVATSQDVYAGRQNIHTFPFKVVFLTARIQIIFYNHPLVFLYLLVKGILFYPFSTYLSPKYQYIGIYHWYSAFIFAYETNQCFSQPCSLVISISPSQNKWLPYRSLQDSVLCSNLHPSQLISPKLKRSIMCSVSSTHSRNMLSSR